MLFLLSTQFVTNAGAARRSVGDNVMSACTVKASDTGVAMTAYPMRVRSAVATACPSCTDQEWLTWIHSPPESEMVASPSENESQATSSPADAVVADTAAMTTPNTTTMRPFMLPLRRRPTAFAVGRAVTPIAEWKPGSR